MNPTPEQLKQWEEDYCADKLAGRSLKPILITLRSNSIWWKPWTYGRICVKVQYGLSRDIPCGTPLKVLYDVSVPYSTTEMLMEKFQDKEEPFDQYLARRMKEQE